MSNQPIAVINDLHSALLPAALKPVESGTRENLACWCKPGTPCPAALETMRCDDCQCLLYQQERANARDTGFQECSDCAFKRHNAGVLPNS